LGRSEIVYADSDKQRLSKVTETLVRAGYSVWPCLGDGPVSSPHALWKPDLVLLGPGLGELLSALATTLWPEVPIVVLSDSEDYSQLPARIASAVSRRRYE